MPAQYTAIRNNLEAQGMPEAAAKSEAAATYNSMPAHKNAPVTGRSEPPTPRAAGAVHQQLRQHMRRQALLRQMG